MLPVSRRSVPGLIPFLHQKEVPYVSVFNAVAAHVELVKRNDVFREVVADAAIYSELTGYSLFRRKQIGYLDVELLSVLVAYKINFLALCPADGYLVTSAQEFEIDYVLKDEINVLCVAAADGLADAVVRYVVLFVGGKNLLAL